MGGGRACGGVRERVLSTFRSLSLGRSGGREYLRRLRGPVSTIDQPQRLGCPPTSEWPGPWLPLPCLSQAPDRVPDARLVLRIRERRQDLSGGPQRDKVRNPHDDGRAASNR